MLPTQAAFFQLKDPKALRRTAAGLAASPKPLAAQLDRERHRSPARSTAQF